MSNLEHSSAEVGSSGDAGISTNTAGNLERGIVKWFNDSKGFGFIEHSSGKDVFVHYSVIEWDGFKTLKDGEEVYYELSQGDKGLHAARVVRRAEAGDNSPEKQPEKQGEPVASLRASIEVERLGTAGNSHPVNSHPVSSQNTTASSEPLAAQGSEHAIVSPQEPSH